MSSFDKDKGTAADGSPDKEQPVRLNPFFEPFFAAFAALLFILVKPSVALRKHSYDIHPASRYFGYVIAMAAGIAGGYWAGWVKEWTVNWWIVTGVASWIATYYYLWPGLYAGPIRHLGTMSEKLWRVVDQSESHSWVTGLLMAAGYVATTVGAGILGWNTFTGVEHNVHIEMGLWPIISWPVGLAVGAIVGFGVGALAWSLLAWGRMWFVAPVTGLAAVYVLSASTAAAVGHCLSGWPTVVAQSGTIAAYALEFVIYLAYLFPLAHVVLTHGFSWLGDLLHDLLERVYGDSRNEYRTFFAQSVNIWFAFHSASLSLLLWPLAGIAVSATVATAVACLVGFLAYVLIGRVLSRWEGNIALVGAAVSVHVAAKVGFAYYQLGYAFGLTGAVATAILAGVTTFFLAFPLLYDIARVVLTFTQVYRLGALLDKVHEAVFNGVDRIADELVHAYDNTYEDTSAYRQIFLQVVNLAVAGGIGFGMYSLANLLGFAGGLAWTTTAALGLLSYILVGKGLVDARKSAGYQGEYRLLGNRIVGWLVSIAVGVAIGAYAFSAVAFGFWTALAVAVAAGLLAAGFTFGMLFPVVYVLLKGISYVVRAEFWLHPLLVGLHDRVWTVFSHSWKRIAEYYNLFDRKLKPYMQAFSDQWEAAKQRVRDSWDRANKK